MTDRFAPDLCYHAARRYHLDGLTQAQIATELGVSRPTVSRLLAQARTSGIVRIDVVAPSSGESVADAVRRRLALRAVYVAPIGTGIGAALADQVARALLDARLTRGDALLVSSGATVFAAAQQPLPALAGVEIYPTSGGVNEPESAYQTNEIVRTVALKVHGEPAMLYAPALPGRNLHELLLTDDTTQRVVRAWRTARAALLGVGAPLAQRSLVPSVFADAVSDAAVGDICMRPFDDDGAPVELPGLDRLVSMTFEDLRRVPHAIAVAAGESKIVPLLAAARGGLYNTLVTDLPTAEGLLVEAARGRRPGDQRTS